MRLTRKRKRKSKFFEFIVMMVFCFVVGYCIRILLDNCPIVLWVGVGIFSAYCILLFIAMAILVKQTKADIKNRIRRRMALEEDDDLEEWDWIIKAFEIGQRVLKKIEHCFILIGGIFFVCSIMLHILPKPETGVSLSGKDLEEIILQNHAKLLEDNEILQQNLKEDYYKNATEEEQLKVLNAVLVTEAFYLGIEAPKLRVDVLVDNLGGYFDVKAHEIVVNQKNISDEAHILNTLFHEMYHAYQYTCVKQLELTGDLLWAKQLAEWKIEFEQESQDVSTNDGMIEYYTQSIEESAREYAKQRSSVYFYYMEN